MTETKGILVDEDSISRHVSSLKETVGDESGCETLCAVPRGVETLCKLASCGEKKCGASALAALVNTLAWATTRGEREAERMVQRIVEAGGLEAAASRALDDAETRRQYRSKECRFGRILRVRVIGGRCRAQTATLLSRPTDRVVSKA